MRKIVSLLLLSFISLLSMPAYAYSYAVGGSYPVRQTKSYTAEYVNSRSLLHNTPLPTYNHTNYSRPTYHPNMYYRESYSKHKNQGCCCSECETNNYKPVAYVKRVGNKYVRVDEENYSKNRCNENCLSCRK